MNVAVEVSQLTTLLREVSEKLLAHPAIVADYEARLERSKLELGEARAALETAEALATDDALSQEGLTNDTKRKAAVTKALQKDPTCIHAAESVRIRQGSTRMAEISLSQVVSEGKALAFRLQALRASAELKTAQIEHENLALQARTAEANLRGVSQCR